MCGAKLGVGRSKIKKYLLYILKPIANIFWGVDKCVSEINKVSRKFPYEKAKYVGDIVGGIYGIGERLPKDGFEKSIEVVFENHIFPTYSCWETYLTGCHGDYMQLPPVEKRKIHIRKVLIED